MAPDPQFFDYSGPLQLADILAEMDHIACDLEDLSSQEIKSVAPLNEGSTGDISFFDNIKYKADLEKTEASFCLINSKFKDLLPDNVTGLYTDSPYKDYAIIAQTLYGSIDGHGSISEQAIIDPTATISENVTIEPGAVVHAGVHIAKGSYIESGAIIRRNVQIGAHCRIGSTSVLSHCYIDDHVHIYSGVKIGQDGFGFAMDLSGYIKVPQLGVVRIGKGVNIGSNSTIDRGSLHDTIIGDGTWIDNLVQIAHNVKVGKMCVIVSQVGISGSTVLEDFVVLGGQVGLAGHIHIGTGARLGAKAGVMRDVPAGEEYLGAPAVPKKEFMRQITTLKRLVKEGKANKKRAK